MRDNSQQAAGRPVGRLQQHADGLYKPLTCSSLPGLWLHLLWEAADTIDGRRGWLCKSQGIKEEAD